MGVPSCWCWGTWRGCRTTTWTPRGKFLWGSGRDRRPSAPTTSSDLWPLPPPTPPPRGSYRWSPAAPFPANQINKTPILLVVDFRFHFYEDPSAYANEQVVDFRFDFRFDFYDNITKWLNSRARPPSRSTRRRRTGRTTAAAISVIDKLIEINSLCYLT